MNTINTITYYDSIKELPASRYSELQKMIAYDTHVGSSFDDVVTHLKKLLGYVATSKHEELSKEATNLHNNYFFLMSGFNFASMTFACMVKEINGEPVIITDENSIKEISDRIGTLLTQGEVESKVSELKKNSIANLRATSQKILTTMTRQIMQGT